SFLKARIPPLGLLKIASAQQANETIFASWWDLVTVTSHQTLSLTQNFKSRLQITVSGESVTKSVTVGHLATKCTKATPSLNTLADLPGNANKVYACIVR